MKRVLIIGAHSYIANALESYLNNKMVVDKVSASNHEWKNIELEHYDSIVMLAAIVHRKEQKDMEQLYREVNCELPVLIATKAKLAGVGHFIFISTAAVYGSKANRITSMTQPQPDTLYGKWKLEAERRLCELEEPNLFIIGIVRPPMVYGEGCKGNYPRLVRLAKYTPVFPTIHNKRSMIHIDTLCDYLVKMILNEEAGVLLPQDENYVDISLFVKEIRSSMGKKTILIPGFAWLIRLMMRRIGILRKIFGDCYYEKE